MHANLLLMNCIWYMNHSDWHLSFQLGIDCMCALWLWNLQRATTTRRHNDLHFASFTESDSKGKWLFCVCTSSSLSRCLLAKKKKESRARGWCSGLLAAAPRWRAVTRMTKQHNVCIFCRAVVNITILPSSNYLAFFSIFTSANWLWLVQSGWSAFCRRLSIL